MPVRYILSSVWVRLSIFSPLSIIQYVGLYVFSLPISLVMIERIYILCLIIIIIKSEVWTITHCLRLGHETMVPAVCLSIFFWIYSSIYIYQNICCFVHVLWWKEDDDLSYFCGTLVHWIHNKHTSMIHWYVARENNAFHFRDVTRVTKMRQTYFAYNCQHILEGKTNPKPFPLYYIT